jgi:class 3 adenylate cyclase/tetratricopeptide (TPR) repeat protein
MAKTDEPKLRLAAIIVADVANYSGMMAKHEAATLSRFNAVRHDIVEPAIKANNGRIFNTTGDGWLAEFPSSVDALLAAIRIQNGAASFNAGTPEDTQIRFRMGIHQGQVRPDGGNLTGPGIIVAARLEPLCPIGGLAVSHRIREDAAGRLSLSFADQGERELKGIADPVRWHRVEPPLPLVSDIDLPDTVPRADRRRRVWPWALAGGAALAVGAGWMTMIAPHRAMMMARPIASMVGMPKPAPIAHAGHLLIAVAHLQDDRDHEHEHLLLDRLANDFDGAQTTQVDETITPPDAGIAQDALVQAKAQANQLRAEAGADVLLWGTVQTLGGKTAMRLYWTTGEAMAGSRGSGLYQDQADTIALPALFWDDLKQVLGLLVQSRLADLRRQLTGQYSAPQLAPLIDQVRTLLQTQQGVWKPETDARVRFTLAEALSDYGNQAGKTDALKESLDAFTQVLRTWTRDTNPRAWAAAQRSYGVALRLLAKRESSAARFEAAAIAQNAALQVFTRDAAPDEWATTQTELGNTLQAWGELDSSKTRLEAAIAAYRAALEVRTRDTAPTAWAATQLGLANALRALAEPETGTEHLRQAVEAYNNALQETTRARAPLDWARLQSNLGLALEALGERETGTARFAQAIAAYRQAEQEITRAKEPLMWAGVEQNLGFALKMQGDRVTGTQELTEAVDAYRGALLEATRERDPSTWAAAQNNLGAALTALGTRSLDAGLLEQAVIAQQNALQIYTHAAAPLNWAQAQTDLGNALRWLGEHEAGTTRLTAAAEAYRGAAKELATADDAADLAIAQLGLGTVLPELAARAHDPALLREAMVALQGAVTAFKQAGDAAGEQKAAAALAAASRGAAK